MAPSFRTFLRAPSARILPLLLAVAVLAGCSTLGLVGALLGDRLSFTAPQLQAQLDRNFPRDYDKLGGLLTLSVLHPRLSIPQGSNRLRLDFDVGVGAPGRDSRTPAGHLAIASGLRWDPSTRGLHLADPSIESLQLAGMGETLTPAARDLVTRWLSDYARREPVYQFDDTLLQRLQSRSIGDTTIENGLVVVHLAP
jgi:hypothetical protein